ncbi:hypothetical protein CIHG_01366 [Coccidioides immitis H538.4]|uniref:Uncharacterized protein n=3 Tax=Coccidioides immitis TaxID=5501 RepID=A0A0J8TGC1_COCIT|nr:hypothetical protein CIRG_01216 [Coccidioides immitis RMSCC 2394]KMU72687.1 hypothetical protein CISG_03122 [Coccidioides immitis RMSCC 3703]KMU83583.1 hypothetical protein CIHG_01366 [Coccidioides immitis H538.4]
MEGAEGDFDLGARNTPARVPENHDDILRFQPREKDKKSKTRGSVLIRASVQPSLGYLWLSTCIVIFVYDLDELSLFPDHLISPEMLLLHAYRFRGPQRCHEDTSGGFAHGRWYVKDMEKEKKLSEQGLGRLKRECACRTAAL